MLLKNKIDKKFRLNKNFNGDQYLGFEFYKDHNSKIIEFSMLKMP